jgi:hypothetical protein
MMSEDIKITPQSTIYLVFIGFAVILIGMAVFYSPSMEELFSGFIYILTHPSVADFDGLSKPGNLGSAHLNAGLVLLLVLLTYKLTNTTISGLQIASAMLAMGFAYYGKNCINIWWPVLGVFIHAMYQKKPLSQVTAMAFFSSAISPIFSAFAFGTTNLGYGTPLAIMMGAAFGIFSGVLVSILAPHLVVLHKGYVLFNIGFAAGIVGIFMHSIRQSLNLGHSQAIMNELPSPSLGYVERYTDIGMDAYITGANFVLGPMLFIMFAYLIICGILLGGTKRYIRELRWYRSKAGNYVEKFGFAPVLLNMGFVGIAATAYIFFADMLVEGHLGGPLFAGVLTAVGFGANGVTVRTHLSLMLGVFLAAFFGGGIAGAIAGDPFFIAGMTRVGTRTMLLAALFICGMCPVPGEHGFKAGVIMGIAHALIIPYVGAFHGWMNLYNNGLALAIVATFLYPIYEKWGQPKEVNS